MGTSTALAAAAITSIMSLNREQPAPEPQPAVVIRAAEMPQIVPSNLSQIFLQNEFFDPGVIALYHELRKDFAISHTKMAQWLGVKRRTLYNWLDAPEKATKSGPTIESRLLNLTMLRNEMEQEHYSILNKIAFSPIHGDPSFGTHLIEGASSTILIDHYDTQFSRFESYRRSNPNLTT